MLFLILSSPYINCNPSYKSYDTKIMEKLKKQCKERQLGEGDIKSTGTVNHTE